MGTSTPLLGLYKPADGEGHPPAGGAPDNDWAVQVNAAMDTIDTALGALLPYTLTGASAPEGSVTANPGAIYRTTAGVLWVKASGTGNTGWVDLLSGSIAGSRLVNGSLTYAKLQDVSATSRVLGRATAGAGPMEEITLSALKALLALVPSDITGLGPFATSTDAANLSGAIALARIADGLLTYAKVQNISATSRFLGRKTAGAGVLEELSPTDAKTILAIAATDVSGLSVLATNTDAANLSGTLNPARIANAALVYAKLQNVSGPSIVLGRKTAGAGVVEELNATDLKSIVGDSSNIKITWEARSVKDVAYGAVGDGATDADGAAINAAIAAAGAGAQIVIPPGVYNTTVPIATKAGVSVTGRGRPIIRAVTGFPNTGRKCLLDGYDKMNPMLSQEISGLALDSNQLCDITALLGRVTLNAPWSASGKLWLHHCVLSGHLLSGVQIGLSTDTGSTADVVVHNNDIVNPQGWVGSSAASSAFVVYLSDAWFHDNIHETTAGQYSAIIHAGGIWRGNHFMGQTQGGVLIDGANNTLMLGNWFDHIEDTVALIIKPASGKAVTGLNIVANRFAGPAIVTDNLVPAILVDGVLGGSVDVVAVQGNMIVGANVSQGFKSILEINNLAATAYVTLLDNQARFTNAMATGGRAPSKMRGNHIHTSTAQGGLSANSRYEDTTHGVASHTTGTTQVITHGLAAKPTFVQISQSLQSAVNPTIAIGASAPWDITLTWPANPGTESIYWEARQQ